MEQIKRLISKLSLKQRVSIGIAAVGMIGVFMFLMNWSKERDFHPMFSSLASEDAALIVQKLKESGVEYRLSADGSTVSVPSSRVSELRLELAGAGIPKSGRIGFELFDKTQLGLTDFSEQVNYKRALEGELERSIAALSEVEQARVHLTFPKESVFVEERRPGKASVLIKLRPGQSMKTGSAAAICNLVASAVDGLLPEAVALVDVNGTLLNRPRKASVTGEDRLADTDADLEYRHRIEKDLLQKINTTLEPLLGPERFRASVSVECDFSTGEQSEETFNPDQSVMLSSQKTEDSTTPGAAPAGVPGTQSSLPRAVTPSTRSGSATSRKTENIQFQTSRVVKRISTPRGVIRKISTAVLLDHYVSTIPNGNGFKKQVRPPTPEEIKSIRQVVAGIIGFDEQRGDQIILEALPFEATAHPFAGELRDSAPANPSSDWLQRLQNDRILQTVTGIAVAAALCLLGFIVFLIRGQRKKRKAAVQVQAALASAEATPAVIAAASEKQIASPTVKADALLAEVRNHLKNDPVMCAQVLRVWLQEEKV